MFINESIYVALSLSKWILVYWSHCSYMLSFEIILILCFVPEYRDWQISSVYVICIVIITSATLLHTFWCLQIPMKPPLLKAHHEVSGASVRVHVRVRVRVRVRVDYGSLFTVWCRILYSFYDLVLIMDFSTLFV